MLQRKLLKVLRFAMKLALYLANMWPLPWVLLHLVRFQISGLIEALITVFALPWFHTQMKDLVFLQISFRTEDLVTVATTINLVLGFFTATTLFFAWSVCFFDIFILWFVAVIFYDRIKLLIIALKIFSWCRDFCRLQALLYSLLVGQGWKVK